MSQSPKTLEFLQKLKDSGNWYDNYDYSKVNYTGIRNKIIVICKEHGEFNPLPVHSYFKIPI